jgi:hypothetical protein
MRRTVVLITAAALLAVAAAGCGQDGAVPAGTLPEPPATTADGGSGGGSTGGTGGGSTGGNGGGAAAPAETSLEVWFHQGESLYMVRRSVPATRAVGRAALEELMRGPGDAGADVGTQVPAGTRLLGLDISDGVATVDLSSEFESGGGRLSMTMRLAQVVFTLTQFETVDGVQFRLDGRPVNVFSGEGIVLDHPVGRKDYEELQPLIVVDQPASGAIVASPAVVIGKANVFEANVTVLVLDAAGKEIARDFTTATCGTGCWGRFSIRLPFSVAARGPGTIVVQDDDADGDGQPAHQVKIPVVLMP